MLTWFNIYIHRQNREKIHHDWWTLWVAAQNSILTPNTSEHSLWKVLNVGLSAWHLTQILYLTMCLCLPLDKSHQGQEFVSLTATRGAIHSPFFYDLTCISDAACYAEHISHAFVCVRIYNFHNFFMKRGLYIASL